MTDVWEWELPHGVRIVAEVDRSSGVESVWLDARLVSRSGPNGKLEGHAFPLALSGDAYRVSDGCAHVAFDVTGTTLVVDDRVVPPTRVSRRRPRSRGIARASVPAVLGLVGVAVGSLALGAAVAVLARAERAPTAHAQPTARRRLAPSAADLRTRSATRTAQAETSTALTSTWRSDDGAIVAHAPADFDAAVEPTSIALTRAGELVSIAEAATPADDGSDAIRSTMVRLAHRIGGNGATLSAIATTEGPCHGEHGVTASAVVGPEPRTKLWACGFTTSRRAYTFAFTVPEERADDDAPLLTRIVEATELPAPQQLQPLAAARTVFAPAASVVVSMPVSMTAVVGTYEATVPYYFGAIPEESPPNLSSARRDALTAMSRRSIPW